MKNKCILCAKSIGEGCWILNKFFKLHIHVFMDFISVQFFFTSHILSTIETINKRKLHAEMHSGPICNNYCSVCVRCPLHPLPSYTSLLCLLSLLIYKSQLLYCRMKLLRKHSENTGWIVTYTETCWICVLIMNCYNATRPLKYPMVSKLLDLTLYYHTNDNFLINIYPWLHYHPRLILSYSIQCASYS